MLPLNVLKALQILMDRPNVNLKMLKVLKSKIQTSSELSNTIMFDLGTCGLHTLHNSFKCAIKAPKWPIVEFLRAIYNLFKNTPSRRADYIQFTGCSIFPKKFCSVR